MLHPPGLVQRVVVVRSSVRGQSMRRIALQICVLVFGATSLGLATTTVHADSRDARLQVSVQVVSTCNVSSDSAELPTVSCGRGVAPIVTIAPNAETLVASVQF